MKFITRSFGLNSGGIAPSSGGSTNKVNVEAGGSQSVANNPVKLNTVAQSNSEPNQGFASSSQPQSAGGSAVPQTT